MRREEGKKYGEESNEEERDKAGKFEVEEGRNAMSRNVSCMNFETSMFRNI